MSYLALLVHCIVSNERFKDEYFTVSGSSHGADQLFSDHIDSKLDDDYKPIPVTLAEWHDWHEHSVEHHSHGDVCVLRSGWNAVLPETWQSGLNSLDQALVLVSSPNTKLDWLYCWFNMVNKVPGHVYRTLQSRSKFYPRLWARDKVNMLPRRIKIEELSNAMPVHPLKEGMDINKPTFRFLTTEILDENFPLHLGNFLSANGIRAHLNDDIFAWHRKFASKQMPNYLRAKDLAQGHAMKSRGPFDDILLRYLADRNPWSTL